MIMMQRFNNNPFIGLKAIIKHGAKIAVHFVYILSTKLTRVFRE
jgi:hypothetical protein